MKFTDPQGRTLDVNSPDGSMPSEGELDQMFSMKYGGQKQAVPQIPQQATPQPTQPQEGIGQMLLRNTGMAARNTLEAGGRALNSATFGIPGAISQGLSGGRVVNPLTHGLNMMEGGTNIFEGKDLSGGDKLQADVAGMVAPIGGVAGLMTRPLLKALGNISDLKKVQKSQETLSEMNFKNLKSEAEKIGAEYPSIDAITRKLGLQKAEKVQPLQEAVNSEKSTFSQVKDSLKKDIADTQKIKTEKLKLTKDAQANQRAQTMAELKQTKADTEKALTGEASDVVKYLKDSIPEKIKSYNKGYGDRIEQMAEALDKNGQGISHAENLDILQKTMQEADDIGINTGRARSVLEQEHAAALKEAGPQESSLVTTEGKPIMLTGNGQEFIRMRDFLMNSRKFKRTLSEAKLSGTKGYSDEDIVTALYNKHFGNFMSQKVEGFGKLQQDYAPVINAMKTARRIFNPGNEYSEEQGVNLLRKYALDSATPKKQQLVEDIQKANPFGEGVDQFSPNLKEFGKKVTLARQKIADASIGMRNKFTKELDTIEGQYAKETEGLKARLKSAEGESQAKQDILKDKISEIEQQHKFKVDEVSDIADRIKTHDMIGADAGKKIAEFKKKRNEVLGLLGLFTGGTVGKKGIEMLSGGK